MATAYKTTPRAQEALDELRAQGFKLPAKPRNEPALVLGDVSELADEQLIDDFILLTAWTDYAAAQLGLAVINEREKERKVEEAVAAAWQDMHKKFPRTPVTVMREVIMDDPQVKRAKVAMDEVYAYRRLLSDLTARYERDASALSRELTRRTSEKALTKARRRYET
jgi:hypothetical protein